MPRYKREQYDQTKMIPIAFEQQLVPGSFEHALVYIVDNELDLSGFDSHYHNDDTGRVAIHPGTLLKIVLFAYSRGITSSRRIEQLCHEKVVFMAVSSDTQPHFTTIADFISRSPEAIKTIFVQILLICDEQGLIGKEMFAIDSCKLPSNASKHWSETHGDLRKKAKKLDKAVNKLLKRHQRDGVAAVDAEHQIIVEASAYGQPQEHGLLQPSVEKTHEHLMNER